MQKRQNANHKSRHCEKRKTVETRKPEKYSTLLDSEHSNPLMVAISVKIRRRSKVEARRHLGKRTAACRICGKRERSKKENKGKCEQRKIQSRKKANRESRHCKKLKKIKPANMQKV